MFSRNYLPQSVQCDVTAANNSLDVSAKRSEDGRALVLQAVNPTDKPVKTQIHLGGFVPRRSAAQVTELAGSLDARNTATRPDDIVPQQRQWQHGFTNGLTRYTFPPSSVTVLRLE
jgi:alpha-L-arabinofuranosidase